MKTTARANKWLCFVFFSIVTATPTFSQSDEIVLKQRANAMHEALKSSDENDWKVYIKANYSKKMIEKYDMSRHIEMFERLHKDFSDSQISSLEVKNDKVLMEIERNNDKHLVTFDISYDATDDYKFNGFSIEAGEL
ncbi:MAG: hypothetical protein HKN31_03105 [Pricia sp.]|nr:hypothetical protein [Pricia sp.]